MKSLALPLLLTALLAGPARAQDAAAAAKAIGKTYAAVEAKLKDSTHARWEIAHMEEEFTHKCDIWIAPEGHPLKVSDDIAGMDIRRLTEYVFDGEALVFVLLREEKGHGASITVHEDRLYFAKGKLFHYLAKEANFKSGAKLDVSAVKNAPQKIAADDDSFACRRDRRRHHHLRDLPPGAQRRGAWLSLQSHRQLRCRRQLQGCENHDREGVKFSPPAGGWHRDLTFL